MRMQLRMKHACVCAAGNHVASVSQSVSQSACWLSSENFSEIVSVYQTTSLPATTPFRLSTLLVNPQHSPSLSSRSHDGILSRSHGFSSVSTPATGATSTGMVATSQVTDGDSTDTGDAPANSATTGTSPANPQSGTSLQIPYPMILRSCMVRSPI